MATARFVSAPLVVVTDEGGHHVYLYEGAQVPSNVPADEVKRLDDEGFLADEETPDKAPAKSSSSK